jgi:hypothetical protein
MASTNDDVNMDASQISQPPVASQSVLRRKRDPPVAGPSQAGPSGSVPSQSSTTDQTREIGPSPPKKSKDGPTTLRTKAAIKAKKGKQKRPNDWHLKKKEVPKEAKATKVSHESLLFAS